MPESLVSSHSKILFPVSLLFDLFTFENTMKQCICMPLSEQQFCNSDAITFIALKI